MWLRNFLSKDMPRCRTMIYGYNAKLTVHGADTILDYGRAFSEALKSVRYNDEVRYIKCCLRITTKATSQASEAASLFRCT
jgi:hypothetical protein